MVPVDPETPLLVAVTVPDVALIDPVKVPVKFQAELRKALLHEKYVK